MALALVRTKLAAVLFQPAPMAHHGRKRDTIVGPPRRALAPRGGIFGPRKYYSDRAISTFMISLVPP